MCNEHITISTNSLPQLMTIIQLLWDEISMQISMLCICISWYIFQTITQQNDCKHFMYSTRNVYYDCIMYIITQKLKSRQNGNKFYFVLGLGAGDRFLDSEKGAFFIFYVLSGVLLFLQSIWRVQVNTAVSNNCAGF